MAKLEVKVEKIHEIREHPNADRMELAIISGEGGYQCCVQKGSFKSGDPCIYFPVDSVLTDSLVDTIFGPDSKVKLSKNRVRTIKLRGALSQGMAVPCNVIYPDERSKYLKIGDHLTKTLNVTKYEPPVKGNATQGGRKSTRLNVNPNFHKYTDINHLKKYPEILVGKCVVAFEKIHGTNFRAGWVPSHPKSWFDRLKKRFGFFPKWQFVYGSHNVQLQGKYKGKDFYSKKASVDVYTKMVKQYDLMNALVFGEVIYGEIYGYGIQKNYTYGCDEDEHQLVVVDLKVKDKYVDTEYLLNWCNINGLDFPPVLYIGEFSMREITCKVGGPSILSGTQKVREGLVVRTQHEESSHMGRMIFKYLNPEYLLSKGNTEHH